MELFPRKADGAMGRSDLVSGALVKADRILPGEVGIMIYLKPNPELGKVIARKAPAGGKILLSKTKNPTGYVGIFKDTKGNKIGIFAGS